MYVCMYVDLHVPVYNLLYNGCTLDIFTDIFYFGKNNPNILNIIWMNNLFQRIVQ